MHIKSDPLAKGHFAREFTLNVLIVSNFKRKDTLLNLPTYTVFSIISQIHKAKNYFRKYLNRK